MNTINKRAPGRREKVYYNKGRQLDLSAFEEAKNILDSYRPFKKDMLIEYLHLFNDKFHGLYAKHLRAIAELTKISMSEVYEVASFYAHFKIIDDVFLDFWVVFEIFRKKKKTPFTPST